MENHKEKLAILDKYAVSCWYDDFEELLSSFGVIDEDVKILMKHLHEITDLVQKEALKRASEKVKIVVPGDFTSDMTIITKEVKTIQSSITSEENLIK